MDSKSEHTFRLTITSCIQTEEELFEEKREEFEVTVDQSLMSIQKYEHDILDDKIELHTQILESHWIHEVC